jgi:hypothetical protein
MSTTNAPFGFIPWGPVIRANLYAVATNNTNAIGRGTLIEANGTAYATPKCGVLQGCVDEETGADGSIIGAVLAVFDHNMNPLKYLPATTAGNSVIAGILLVADSPAQLYVAQEDGVTSSLVLDNVGLNADAVGTTVDTNTGLSAQMIDSNTMNTTSTLAFKLVRPHPDDTVNTSTTAGRYSRWIVKLNSSAFGEGAANTGI